MLKETLSKFFKVDSIIENLTGFVETRVELLKIEVKEDLAKGLAKATAWFAIGLIALLFLVFASVGVALLIGERIGTFGGFLVVAGIYLIIATVLYVRREGIMSRLEQKFTDLLRKKK